MSTFYQRFKYAMDCAGLGWAVPENLFGTLTAATGTIGALEAALARLGATATMAELFTASGLALAGDLAVWAAGVSAAYYVGACVGALLFATVTSFGRLPNQQDYNQCRPSDLFSHLSSSPAEMTHAVARHGIHIHNPVVVSAALRRSKGLVGAAHA